MKRKQPTKIQKNPTLKSPGSAIIPSKTFHETFPLTLEFMEGKDFKRCFFVNIKIIVFVIIIIFAVINFINIKFQNFNIIVVTNFNYLIFF